jgi:K+-sensing histidine kinase KdpD
VRILAEPHREVERNLVAARRGPSVLASLLSVAAFDNFFVPPYLTFAVSDTQYLVTWSCSWLDS